MPVCEYYCDNCRRDVRITPKRSLRGNAAFRSPRPAMRGCSTSLPSSRDETPPARVAFGARVTVEDEDGRRTSYALVGPDEVDLAVRQISIASPVASALLGRRAGDRVVLRRPKGDVEVTVVSVALTTNTEIGA